MGSWPKFHSHTPIPGLVACGDGKEVRAVAMIWDTGSKTGEVTGHTKQARLRKCIQMGFLLLGVLFCGCTTSDIRPIW